MRMSVVPSTFTKPLLMNPSTVEQLKALRLTGMLEAWSEQQSLPTYHDLSSRTSQTSFSNACKSDSNKLT